jgi:alpha-tubulin suppressor-like RCC1 family protein
MIGETGDHHWAEQGFVDSGPDGATLLLSSSLAIGDEQDGTHQQILIQAERLDEMEDAWQLWVGYDPSESIVFDDDDIALPAAPSPFSGKRSVFGSSKRWDPDDLSFDKLVDDERVPALEGNYRIFMAEHRDNECVSPSRPRTACLTVLLQRYNPANQAILGNDWGFHVGRIGSAFDALRSSDGANGDAVLVGKPADSITNVDEEGYWVNVNDQSWLGQPVNTDGSAVRTGPNEWSPLLGSELDREVLAGAMARTLTPYSLLATEPTESSNTKGYGWLMTSSGQDHTLGLDRLGRLWAWGGNSLGQLGQGAGGPVSSIGPVLVKTPSPHPGRWMYVSAGNGFSLGIDVDGKAWAWGANGDGQLGDGTVVGKNLPVPVRVDDLIEAHPGSWTLVSAGGTGSNDLGTGHSLGIDSNGRLWAWGRNSIYQLGDATNTNRVVPMPIIDFDASELLSKWRQLSAGEYHSIGIDDLGRAWAWGDNFYGQLGIGLLGGNSISFEDPPDSNVPALVAVPQNHPGTWKQLSAGYRHSLGIDTNNKAWAWGTNADGRLGNGITLGSKIIPTPVATAGSSNPPATWKQLSAGDSHSLGIASDGTAWAWGFNASGRLGVGDTALRTIPTPVDAADGRPQYWKQLSAGGAHSLGIASDDTAWAWGFNGSGRLGVGDIVLRTIPTSVATTGSSNPPATWKQLSAGDSHSLGIASDDTAWAWGLDGNSGNLGITPLPGQILIPTAIDSTNVSKWKQLSPGGAHSLGISADLINDGLAWGWGSNNVGQLGRGDEVDIITGPEKSLDVYALEGEFVSDSAGSEHTILISVDGKIYTAGSNEQGQLGLGNAIADSDYFTEIEVPSQDSGWVSTSAGHQHTVVIDEETGLWTWGANDSGQLGLGTEEDPIYDPTLSPYLIAWQRTLVSSEIARTKFIRRYGLSPINPNLKLFSTTPGSNQAWIPAGNGSSQLILWRRGIDNEEI